jgi:hypothetical protein
MNRRNTKAPETDYLWAFPTRRFFRQHSPIAPQRKAVGDFLFLHPMYVAPCFAHSGTFFARHARSRYRTGCSASSPKAPSDAAFGMYTTAICLDTSRFRHRLIPLSRTLLLFRRGGSTEPAPLDSQTSCNKRRYP